MTNYEINPFQELYVTDSPDPHTFVELFSAFPVRHALALFRPGHVVLKGTQGSGKSMLLNLLRTQIRLAYYNAEADFPVPEKLCRFIGAGINLTRSGALDIGNRPLSNDPARDDALFPLYFADFLNYYIVRDILNSVEEMELQSKAFGNIVDTTKMDNYARSLASEDCWFGSLDGCESFKHLCSLIDERIRIYRAFHLFNLQQMPLHVENTKTNIGEPIARAAALLRSKHVVPKDIPVFVRIDQVERLYRSDSLRPAVGQQYRRIVNKALALRDSRVWYRIGTRQYAWQDDLTIFGTSDRLEHLRDFRVIDLDEMLRRREDTKTWIFPKFASDAFGRRLKHGLNRRARDDDGEGSDDLIRKVFGETEDPSAAAKGYVQNSSAERVLRLVNFPQEWRDFLERLFASDPLTATLAAAWALQRGTEGRKGDRTGKPPPKDKPWNRPYWRKERIRQALVQIAARSSQRLKWSGKEHVLGLSAGNICIFLSICHEIWDAFLRAERRKPLEKRRDPIIFGLHQDVQAVGIQTASVYWYEKIIEQPNGNDRQRFLNVIAAEFRSWLVNDEAMSYPGRNGFSLKVDELAQQPAIEFFLGSSADHGDLYEVQHTTKEKDRKQRKKWYLSPILSAYYQVPESHVKEPYYATIPEVIQWIKAAQIRLRGLDYEPIPLLLPKVKPPSTEQLSIFDDIGKEQC